jgi:hypothetical protein
MRLLLKSSINCSKKIDSLRLPGLRRKVMRLPFPSQLLCILLLKLPRERPSFSCDSPPFFHPRGVGVQESRFDRPNKPDSLGFGVSPHRLVGLVGLVCKYRLFATDKTVLLGFPTCYNVHRRSCHNAPVLIILWMPFTTCRWS